MVLELALLPTMVCLALTRQDTTTLTTLPLPTVPMAMVTMEPIMEPAMVDIMVLTMEPAMVDIMVLTMVPIMVPIMATTMVPTLPMAMATMPDMPTIKLSYKGILKIYFWENTNVFFV